MRAWRTGIEERGGTAAFALDAAGLDACPFRARLLAVDARACASALFGRLSATGSNTNDAPGTVSRPFAATGAAAIMMTKLHPVIELSGRASIAVNLVRDSFEFA